MILQGTFEDNSAEPDHSILTLEAYLRQELLSDQLRLVAWDDEKAKRMAKDLQKELDCHTRYLKEQLTPDMKLVIDRFPSTSLKLWKDSLQRSLRIEQDHCEPFFRIAYELRHIQEIYERLEDTGKSETVTSQRDSLIVHLEFFEGAIRQWMVSELSHGSPIEEMVAKLEKTWDGRWDKLIKQASTAVGGGESNGGDAGGFHPLETFQHLLNQFTPLGKSA